MILVACDGTRYHLVRVDLSSVSAQKDATCAHPTYGCNACAVIFKGLYGHYASYAIIWVQVHCAGPLFPDTLARVGDATIRDRKVAHSVHSEQHNLSLGNPFGDRYRQWCSLCQGNGVSFQTLSYYTYTNLWLQLVSEWIGRMFALQRTTSLVQGVQWRSE